MGKKLANALRQIKLEMIRQTDNVLYHHPYFWSPTVIFGDGN
jgi:CHAT domain-containing protein